MLATAEHVRFDAEAVRADFPALDQEVHGRPLVYLDNAATSQKPQAVLDRLRDYYAQENANIHRGVHALSQRATDAYEAARQEIAHFIGAEDDAEVIFTRGCTEGINLVASTFGRTSVREGDEVVISAMEHHSNIVPWQMLCEQQGARLRVIPISDAGELDYDAYLDLLSGKTKLVAVAHISNALGTINPVQAMIRDAHARGIPVLVDGAQAVPHGPVDVRELDADFYCFSGHKTFGPTGIGVLYGKRQHLEAMPPYQGGGDMIDEVTFERTTYNTLPHKFEAGTPHIAGVLGLAEAVRYLQKLGPDAVRQYEADLLTYATEQVKQIDGVRLVGTAREKASVLSFLMADVHPYDAGLLLDRMGIAVRTGHHCTQPLMRRLGIPGTIRASFAFYNTRADVDRLVEGLREVRRQMGRETQATMPAARTDETIAQRQDELAEAFETLGDPDLKRDYLMDLGKALPDLDPAYKVEKHRIHGCQSAVWLHAERQCGRVVFEADSNAMITRGLIALLVRVLSGQPPRAILEADLDAFMDRIGMQHLISQGRKNGLAAMIKQMKLYAVAFEKMGAFAKMGEAEPAPTA